MTATPRPPSFEVALAGVLRTHPLVDTRVPADLLSREQKAGELQRVVAAEAKLAAYKAELVLGLADDSPVDDDPAPGTPGARSRSWAPDGELPGVSEFFTTELAVVLNCGRGTASHLAARAWTYRENLPATWAALAAGALDEPRAKMLTGVLEHAEPDVARAIEAELSPVATELSAQRLKKRTLALLVQCDSDAVDRRRKRAERSADVRTYPSPLEGMTTPAVDLSPEGAACYAVVDQLATLAGRSDQPGEVGGVPITAAHLRALLEQLGALCPGGLQAPDGGDLVLSLTDDGALRATLTSAQLERLVRRSCTEHRAADCECPLLDRPQTTDDYEPSDPQRRFVTTRDRRCRFPNCGQRAGWADLDHVVPRSCGGETDCAHLCCLCRTHHRLKTFARGWRFAMTDDGTLHVTTPSGITRTTRPPGLRPPVPEPPAPPPTTEPSPWADDPPPF